MIKEMVDTFVLMVRFLVTEMIPAVVIFGGFGALLVWSATLIIGL